MPENFGSRLDLAVRFVNAVDGSVIREDQAVFFHNKKALKPRQSEHAYWLFADTGRADFILGVNVHGFEKTQITVSYKMLCENLPTMEIPLVPRQSAWNNPPLLTVEGKMEGLEEVQAVAKRESDVYAVSYEERDCKLSLCHSRRTNFADSYYALASSDWQEFEIVRILKKLPADMVQIDHALKKRWQGICFLVHPVYGTVSEEGRYLLRVPVYGKDAGWLARFVVRGKEYFQDFDVRNPIISMEEDNVKG